MELFDLVDNNDAVTGTTHKPEAHANNLLHRAVAVFVFRQNGELYVQVHKKSGRLDHSVGGHVSKGEDYDTAAMREAEEEIGLKQPLRFVCKFYSDENDMQHMFAVYECVAEATWQFVPNDEVDEIIPMSLNEIRNQMTISPSKFTGGFINTLDEYCRIKQIT